LNKLKILEEQIENYMNNYKLKDYYIEYLKTKKFGYQKILENFSGSNVLELGSDGAATSSILMRWSKNLTIVDMMDKFTPLIKEDPLLSEATFIQSKWENFSPKTKFSDILLTDSLEHVDNPIAILKLTRSWLKEEGRLHIIVPNALSFHRLIGVEMNYLKSPYDFNENDIRSGHQRVYDFDTLKNDIKSSDLSIDKIEGVQLKFLTDAQLNNFNENYKNALNSLSNKCDEHCAEIYACCKKN